MMKPAAGLSRTKRLLLVVLVLSACGGLCLAEACPACKREMAREARFCNHCGRRAAKQTLDGQVEAAIAKAVKFLLSTQREDGAWKPIVVYLDKSAEGATRLDRGKPKKDLGEMPFPVGTTSLCAYALLESGIQPGHKQMAKALRWLARQKTTKTYSLGLRANVWMAAARAPGARKMLDFNKLLDADAKALIRGARDGAYSYECPGPRGAWDNSNSQYGLLGVWAAARANVEGIPAGYWQAAARHWLRRQRKDGGWGYSPAGNVESYPGMTVAGLASLLVCTDNLAAGRYVTCRGQTHMPAIEKALAWLDSAVRKTGLDTPQTVSGETRSQPADMYYLFGVERVALASGYKHFGGVGWYAEGAKRILRVQYRDGRIAPGGYGDYNIGTAYALLYLARGRHPVVFNRLRHGGDWNNRPHAAAHLMRWMSRTFERTLRWQIVRLTDPVEEWHDAPVLLITGSRKADFSDDHLAALRRFVYQGGTLFVVAECGGGRFKTEMREAYVKMFPGRPLLPLGFGHELFRSHFTVSGRGFHAITNGVRPLVIHCDFDLPLHWQLRRVRTSKWTFEIAANLAMYVSSKGAFRPRGVSHWPPAPSFKPRKTITLARLKHAGNFDPEPLAYQRLTRLLGAREQIRLNVLAPMPIADLAATRAKIATLTGTGKLALTDAEKSALKTFVTSGGTLVIDAAGGDPGFSVSAFQTVTDIFSSLTTPLPNDSKIYALPGKAITTVRYRGRAGKRLGASGGPALRTILLSKRPAVVISAEDITAALVGFDSAACSGYAPESAYQIMRNILLAAS